MNAIRRIAKWLVPGEEATREEDEDEREQWPSRLSFILASMGGAVGVGNLIRYPSIALRNNGLQWFIPYVGALLFIGLPILSLEISIGSAFRSGNVIAFNRLSKRLRGVGLSAVFLGYIAATYYVVIMSYVMTFFRYSFHSPLPFKDNSDFFPKYVHQNPAPVAVGGWNTYPVTGVVWETLAWSVFSWAAVYASIFRGVSLTGKVVYVTMLLPLVTTMAILIRAVTLENAGRGIRMYVGEWNGYKLQSGNIWKDAIIQIFYSVGTGFGIFTAYASYNPRGANAIQDVVIIACGNSLVEMSAAFAAFGVLGYQNIRPDPANPLGTFEVGFITYPIALAKLPGANVWSILFFFTLYLLGIDSAFAYLEGLITAVSDTNWGRKMRKSFRAFLIVFIAMLLSFKYATRFGYHLLGAVDNWVTGIALMLSTWAECVGATSLYRHRDVIDQTGMPAFVLALLSYVGSMVIGVIVGNLSSPVAGVATFVVILIIGTLSAAVIAKRPQIVGSQKLVSILDGQDPLKKVLSALWWLTSYSGHQLARDLNAVVAQGKNWGLPFFWAPLLRWLAAPVLMTILSISYSEFKEKSRDPLHIFGFIFAHAFVICIIGGLILPRWFSLWISVEEKEAHKLQYATSPTVPLPAEQIVRDPVDAEDADEKKLNGVKGEEDADEDSKSSSN